MPFMTKTDNVSSMKVYLSTITNIQCKTTLGETQHNITYSYKKEGDDNQPVKQLIIHYIEKTTIKLKKPQYNTETLTAVQICGTL